MPRTDQRTTERIRCRHIDTDAVLAAIEFLLDLSADLTPADRGVLLRAAQELLDLGPDPSMLTVLAPWLAEPFLALSI